MGYYYKIKCIAMNKDRLILITNDDGIEAKGINELIKCLKGLGKLIVFAPDGPRSGMSSAITVTHPITYSLIKKEKDLEIYACTGTPVDCVKIAINEMQECRPDLLIAGINHGGNQAISVHYSGTMGAVIEGCILQIPSFGVSHLNYTADADFSEACRLARILASNVLKEGLPNGTYLNLNVPDVFPVKGLAVCRQAGGCWINEYYTKTGIDGKNEFWMSGEYIDHTSTAPDYDINRLNEGYASLVPCMIDVTNHEFMDTLKKWEIIEN